MPDANTPEPETTGEKTMRRYYEARLAEELMQAAHLAKNRAMLRRGALKQQDGTLGAPGEPEALDEEMNIHIGDITTISGPAEISQASQQPATERATEPVAPKPVADQPTTQQPAAEKSLVQRLAPYLIGAAIAGGPLAGYGVSQWMASEPPPTAQAAATETPQPESPQPAGFTDTNSRVRAVQIYHPKDENEE